MTISTRINKTKQNIAYTKTNYVKYDINDKNNSHVQCNAIKMKDSQFTYKYTFSNNMIKCFTIYTIFINDTGF